jgi:hypothetical protein
MLNHELMNIFKLFNIKNTNYDALLFEAQFEIF